MKPIPAKPTMTDRNRNHNAKPKGSNIPTAPHAIALNPETHDPMMHVVHFFITLTLPKIRRNGDPLV